MQQSTPITNAPTFKPDYLYWTKHFVGLFWRWKWYILLTFPVLVITWLLLVLKYGTVRPELTASVLLGIEKESTVLTLPEASPNGLGKIQLIISRNFLGEIIDSLSLNLVVPKYNRGDILTYLDVDSNAIPGKYRFEIDKMMNFRYTIFISNKKLGLKKKAVTTGVLPSLDTMKTTGMTLVFNPAFLKKPFSFDFFIASRQDAVEDLRSHLVIQGNPKRDPMQEGVIGISLSGTDPELISNTINTIANQFVEKNLGFRKRKTGEVMSALYTQLQAARDELATDENRLSAFKTANPKVGLGSDAQMAISNITILDSKDLDISNQTQDAKDLSNRLSDPGENVEQVTSEALLFLGNRNIPGAIVLQQNFNQLLQQKYALTANRYSPQHPMVKEVERKIDSLHTKSVSLMADFIRKQNEEIAVTKTQKSQALNQLQGMPQKEMQLAALTRQQQINSEIYTNLLSRYNQSKIADETEVPDIYVMDLSVPPEPASIKKELMKLLAIGLFACLALSFGPAAVCDFFDKRARSEEDLKRFVSYGLLESIPVIQPKKSRKKTGVDEIDKGTLAKIDPKLIAAEQTTTYVHELFRSLRTKINYRLDSVQGKSIMITSCDSGDGKSLTAANIAVIAAQQHAPVLLIDADIRRGMLHETLAVDQRPGLTDLLLSEQSVTEQTLYYTIKQTIFHNLFLLSSGQNLQNPTELLATRRFRAIINWASTRFGMVIVDAPPLMPVTDAIVLSNLVSGCVLVVKAGKTNTSDLIKKINEFPVLQSKILGVVLNCITGDDKRRKYNSKYYESGPDKKPSQQLLLTSKLSDIGQGERKGPEKPV